MAVRSPFPHMRALTVCAALAAALLAGALPLSAADQSSFLTALTDKKAATVEDAVTLYVYTLGKAPGDFKKNVELLKNEGILKKKKEYAPDRTLRRGLLSGMVARHLKLKDSLFYLMVKMDRYALRACIAAGIMDHESGEFDPVSGEELIEVMGIVGERSGDDR